MGTWVYVDCFHEITQQEDPAQPFTDLVTACGSGSTVGGLALGIALSRKPVKLHAYCITRYPQFFYRQIAAHFGDLGAMPLLKGLSVEELFSITQAQGAGYAISRTEELECIEELATRTGVLLDPVYTGKAAYSFLKDLREHPQAWTGKKILFIHTGGLLGMFDKCDQLQPLAEALKTAHRMRFKQ